MCSFHRGHLPGSSMTVRDQLRMLLNLEKASSFDGVVLVLKVNYILILDNSRLHLLSFTCKRYVIPTRA